MKLKHKGNFVMVRRGILKHLEDGKLTSIEFAAYLVAILKADKSNGVWQGSSIALAAALGSEVSQQTAERILAKLTKKKYLKSFRVHGQRGNKPYLINRYLITNGEGEVGVVNAADSTNWKKPALFPEGDNEGDSEADTEVDNEGDVEAYSIQPIQPIQSKQSIQVGRAIEGVEPSAHPAPQESQPQASPSLDPNQKPANWDSLTPGQRGDWVAAKRARLTSRKPTPTPVPAAPRGDKRVGELVALVQRLLDIPKADPSWEEYASQLFKSNPDITMAELEETLSWATSADSDQPEFSWRLVISGATKPMLMIAKKLPKITEAYLGWLRRQKQASRKAEKTTEVSQKPGVAESMKFFNKAKRSANVTQ
jgi:hypothetical protein